MIREYEPRLLFHDYLTEGSHGRTGVYMTSQDSDVANEKINQGWICEKCNGGFWMRAPDISLVDITEPDRIYQMGKPADTFSAFTFLKDLKRQSGLYDFINGVIYTKRENFQNFDYYISEGEVLDGEIRIGGNDSRIRELKKNILGEVKTSPYWPRYQQDTRDFLGPTRPIAIESKDISDFDTRSAQFIRLIDDLRQVYYPRSEKVGMKVLKNAINQLPDYEIMIFIPTGCFRYITSFINEATIDRIMLWEVHFDKNRPETIKLTNKNIENRKCLIVDKTYTGKTLDRAAGLVTAEGGIPIRLGLFPKGKTSVGNSEYIMFLDQIIDARNIDLTDSNWLLNTFRSVISDTQ